jgi:hypothetical protein
MGIAGDKPSQLAPIVETTGSGSTDSSAPSPTIVDTTSHTILDVAAPIFVDTASPIIIDTASPTIVDTASATILDVAAPTILDVAAPIIVDTASPTILDVAAPITIDSAPTIAINTSTAAIVDPFPCSTGSASIRVRGFEMAFGSFNFYVDDAGVSELISMTDSVTPADPAAPSAVVTQRAIKNTSLPASPPTSVETDPALESSTPLVGSNNFQDPPPPQPPHTASTTTPTTLWALSRDFRL